MNVELPMCLLDWIDRDKMNWYMLSGNPSDGRSDQYDVITLLNLANTLSGGISVEEDDISVEEDDISVEEDDIFVVVNTIN